MGDKPEATNNNVQVKNRPLTPKSKGRKTAAPPDNISVTYLPAQKLPKKTEAISSAKLSIDYLNFLLFRNYSQEKNHGMVSYLLPYEKELKILAENLGIKGKENLQRVVDILNFCSDRIQDENHEFVILVMAVMLTESHGDEKAVSGVGAHGIMQVMPRTAVDILLRMDDYVLFSLGLHPWDKLHQKIKLIKYLQVQIRRIKPGETEKEITLKSQLNQHLKEAEAILVDQKLLFNPIFNMGLGIFYLSSLIERFKVIKTQAVGEITLVKALAAYNAGPRSDMLKHLNYALKRSNGKIDSNFFKYLPRKAFSQTRAYIRRVIQSYHLIQNNPAEVERYLKKP